MKLKNNKMIYGVVFVLFVTNSCATIISGTRQKVGISSDPVGASVTIDNQNQGRTPLIVRLDRDDNHIVKIDLHGYQPYQTTLNKKLNGWLFGNILFGGVGVIGIIIDVVDGSMYRLKPQTGGFVKEKIAGKKVMTLSVILTSVALNADPSMEKIGELTPVAAQRASFEPVEPAQTQQTASQQEPVQANSFSINQIQKLNSIQESDKALQNRDDRLLGVYQGIQVLPGPGLQDAVTKACIQKTVGVKMIEGTTNTYASEQEAKLNANAYGFAYQYNQNMISHLKADRLSTCFLGGY
ncbi:MAG: hypothetical protein A2048_10345 [Deltaproteobacteria bacterium GWA2_45_12]|nr:MAG: hypothetical protein A2048_10345 [Deltaproteobacteria bacterium GWA2_45_12]